MVRGDSVLYFPSAPFTAPLAAGVLPERDRILKLNGQGISNTRDLVRAAMSVHGFAAYTLQVERDASLMLSLSVTPYFRPARLDTMFELVFCLMLAVAAFTLCRRLPHEISTIPLALSVLLSLVFTCIMPFSLESLAANVLANAGNISSWLLVIFAMFFPWRRGSRLLRVLVVSGVIALYAAFCVLRAWFFVRWMATGLEGFLSSYRQLGQLVIVSDGAAYAVLAALLGSAYARSRLPRDKRMLQWMLAGVLIAFPPYFFLDQLPLILGGPVHQVGLGSLAQLFLSILPIFLLLALTRSTALNLRSFLVRYGVYGTLVLLIIFLFGVVYMPLKAFIAGAYRLEAPLPELLAAGSLVVALGVLRIPIEHIFRRTATGGIAVFHPVQRGKHAGASYAAADGNEVYHSWGRAHSPRTRPRPRRRGSQGGNSQGKGSRNRGDFLSRNPRFSRRVPFVSLPACGVGRHRPRRRRACARKISRNGFSPTGRGGWSHPLQP